MLELFFLIFVFLILFDLFYIKFKIRYVKKLKLFDGSDGSYLLTSGTGWGGYELRFERVGVSMDLP